MHGGPATAGQDPCSWWAGGGQYVVAFDGGADVCEGPCGRTVTPGFVMTADPFDAVPAVQLRYCSCAMLSLRG